MDHVDRQEHRLPHLVEKEIVDDPSMALNDDELRWARQIKDAIHDTPHLRPISDMECAQWAIVTVGQQNLDEVLERVYRLQCFREQYNIGNITSSTSPLTLEGILEEGVALIRTYIKEQQPGHLLTIDHMASQGHYLIVWDRAAFRPAKVMCEDDWRVYQGCTYFIFLILSSNVRAIREGIALILECEGMGYQNYDSHFEERRTVELFGYYPFKTQEAFFLHTPTVAIFLYKAVKPFVSAEFNSSVKLDANVEGLGGSRINTLFNSPTFDEAQDRLLIRLRQYLEQRLRHQLNYKLPSASEDQNEATTMQDEFAAAMAEFSSEFDDFEEDGEEGDDDDL
jgi:CRAL/TRIO domain